MSFCWLFFKVEFVPQAGPSFPGGGSPGMKMPLLQLSLCKCKKGRDGTAALWPVCGMRKWEFPICPVLTTSGDLQLTKLGRVSGHSTRVRTLGFISCVVPETHGLQEKVWDVEIGFAERTLPETLGNEFEAFWLKVSTRYMCFALQLPVHITTHKSLRASTGGWFTPMLPVGQHYLNQSLTYSRFLWTQFKAQ